MPIYEYVCRHCDKSFEEIVFSRNETVTCPGCTSGDVERQLSTFSSPGSRSETGGMGGGCGGCSHGACSCH